MEYHTKINWMLVIILTFGLINTVCGKPTADDKDDEDNFYNDDYYSYDTEDNEVTKTATNAEDDAGPLQIEPTFFERNDIKVNVKEGETAVLECEAKNFRPANLVIWYNNTQILVQGNIKVNNNPRIELIDNNGIKISNVQPSDASLYHCDIVPENIRLNITLNVIPPIHRGVSIFYRGRNVSENALTVEEEDHIELECRADLMDSPKFKWSLNGHRLHDDEATIEDGKLLISVIDSEHAGIYQCMGDDDSSNPPITSFTLDVLYAPKVSTHRHHINTDVGDRAELYCDYKANPIAVVEWKKGGHSLDAYSEKYLMKNTNHKSKNRTILYVKDVHSHDLGEYECNIKNSFGQSQAKVHLSYDPENPQFEYMTFEGKTVTLNWLVRSISPLTEAVINYKIDGSYKWSTDAILSTTKHQENHGMWKLQHAIELTPGLWHAQVKTKNTNGWSHFSLPHDFRISDHEEEDDEADNIINDQVLTAGFIPKSANGSAPTSTLLPSLMLLSSFVATLRYLVPSVVRYL